MYGWYAVKGRENVFKKKIKRQKKLSTRPGPNRISYLRKTPLKVSYCRSHGRFATSTGPAYDTPVVVFSSLQSPRDTSFLRGRLKTSILMCNITLVWCSVVQSDLRMLKSLYLVIMGENMVRKWQLT